MGGHCSERLGLMAPPFKRGIAGPAISFHGHARCDGLFDKGMQARLAEIVDFIEPDAAKRTLFDLGGAGHKDFAAVAAPLATGRRLVLVAARNFGLLSCSAESPLEWLATR